MKLPLLFAGLLLSGVNLSADALSDSDIQAAISGGMNTPASKLWKNLRKTSQVRINRAGLDPIEKKILILSDRERIGLEAAEASRQMRTISVEEVRERLPLNAMDVMLEANCYNNLYAGSLPKWGPSGGVHLVLSVNGEVIQPIGRRTGGSDSVSILPQQHGIVTSNGLTTTYTPLYRSALYERYSLRTWFTFPALPQGIREFTVIAIAGDGKRKEVKVSVR